MGLPLHACWRACSTSRPSSLQPAPRATPRGRTASAQVGRALRPAIVLPCIYAAPEALRPGCSSSKFARPAPLQSASSGSTTPPPGVRTSRAPRATVLQRRAAPAPPAPAPPPPPTLVATLLPVAVSGTPRSCSMPLAVLLLPRALNLTLSESGPCYIECRLGHELLARPLPTTHAYRGCMALKTSLAASSWFRMPCIPDPARQESLQARCFPCPQPALPAIKRAATV